MRERDLRTRVRDYFTKPTLPPRALSISRRGIAAAEVRWRKGRWVINRAAVGPLADGALEPSFEGVNVKNREALARAIEKVIQSAGLAQERKWAVAIPQGACRTFILELEEAPVRKKELAQVLEWKVERFVGVASSELAIVAQRLPSTAAALRCLVVVARSEVMAAYEGVLERLGIQAGFVLPSHLAEVGWLSLLSRGDSRVWSRRGSTTPEKPKWAAAEGHDALLVSIEDELLSMVFARDEEILAVRTVTCSPEGAIDEVHRTLVYYQDKLSRVPESRESGSVRTGKGSEASPSEDALPGAEGHDANTRSGLREAPSAAGGTAAGKAPEDSPATERRKLGLIVVIDHNEEVGGVKAGGAPSGFSEQVRGLCRDLLVTEDLPTIYSLDEERVELIPSVRLSQVASAVGIAGLS